MDTRHRPTAKRRRARRRRRRKAPDNATVGDCCDDDDDDGVEEDEDAGVDGDGRAPEVQPSRKRTSSTKTDHNHLQLRKQ